MYNLPGGNMNSTNYSSEKEDRNLLELVGELDAIIDSSSDGLLICDADGTVVATSGLREGLR